MVKNRLEAFSDGVIAIIITIMVLELKVPHGETFETLKPLWPVFISYILSFIYVAIYWNNHHHMLHAVKHINGTNLWANMHLLFWLSIIPFTTGWMGENHFASDTVALYGFNLLMAAIAYFILSQTFIKSHNKNSDLESAIGNDFKGKISVFIYTIGVIIAFYNSMLSFLLYIVVALMWLIPDRRIENKINHHE